MQQKTVNRIGWLASMMAILMFFSYIDQIILNINGQTGSIILPLVTILNCSVWVSYALLKPQKDWPIFTCNVLGILVGAASSITAIMFA